MEQRSNEWHKFRQKHIGASEAYIIWEENISKWHDLWNQKVHGKQNTFDNYAMKRGRELEPEALQWFNFHVDSEYVPDVKEDPEHNFLSASLDGLSPDGRHLCEIKCPISRKVLEDAKNGEIYFPHFCQMQHQMKVYGANKVYYIIYFSPDDAHVFECERDNEWLEQYLPKARRFWNMVEKKIAPIQKLDDPILSGLEFQLLNIIEEEEVLKKRLSELSEQKEILLDDAIKICKDVPTQGNYLTFMKQSRKGAVDYASIPELFGLDLEKYRKEPIEYWKVKVNK